MQGRGVKSGIALFATLVAWPGAADAPRFSAAGPEAEAYGADQNYPIGTRFTTSQQRFLVGAYSHFDALFRSRQVARGATASPLRQSAEEFSLTYTHRGERRTLDDYLARHPVTGFLVAQGDALLTERYQYGRTDKDRFLSQSMAKTITAMLIGIAVEEKAIRSIEEPVETYVKALAGTQYGATSIRALLQMSSGVFFSELYDGNDDIAKLSYDLFRADTPGATAVVSQFNSRIAPAGARFSYASVETEVLGLVLREATGVPVADYLSSRIWKPMGAEAEASWIVDGAGQETTYCCFNAILRDYARLGLLLAHGGAAGGRQIIPRDWLTAATTVSARDGHLAPGVATPFYGYGYQVWLFPGERRMFALQGIRGQAIFVDPQSKLVLAQTAVRKLPRDPAAAELVSLWRALVAKFGR